MECRATPGNGSVDFSGTSSLLAPYPGDIDSTHLASGSSRSAPLLPAMLIYKHPQR